MYETVKPRSYWWIPWSLFRRAILIAIYTNGQSSIGMETQHVSFRWLLCDSSKDDPLTEAVVWSKQCNESPPTTDWLTLAAALFCFDIILQQYSNPFIVASTNAVETISTVALVSVSFILLGVDHFMLASVLMVSCVGSFIAVVLFYWFVVHAKIKAQAEEDWGLLAQLVLPNLAWLRAAYDKHADRRVTGSSKCKSSSKSSVSLELFTSNQLSIENVKKALTEINAALLGTDRGVDHIGVHTSLRPRDPDELDEKMEAIKKPAGGAFSFWQFLAIADYIFGHSVFCHHQIKEAFRGMLGGAQTGWCTEGQLYKYICEIDARLIGRLEKRSTEDGGVQW